MARSAADQPLPFGIVDAVTLLKIGLVVAAIVAVGSNITYAVWLQQAGLHPDRLPFVIRTIRILDRALANPAYVVVLLTGIGMVVWGRSTSRRAGSSLALGLYVFVVIVGIALYAPAIRRQLAAAEADPTSVSYRQAARRSLALGILTVVTVLVIVVLMVAKPL
jgi:uncharacterized membrane protein